MRKKNDDDDNDDDAELEFMSNDSDYDDFDSVTGSEIDGYLFI